MLGNNRRGHSEQSRAEAFSAVPKGNVISRGPSTPLRMTAALLNFQNRERTVMHDQL